jgi:hypothetical protein
VTELAFAIHDQHDGGGWCILTYDCSYFGAVKTQQEAQKILAATNWRKWMKKGDKK